MNVEAEGFSYNKVFSNVSLLDLNPMKPFNYLNNPLFLESYKCTVNVSNV